MMEEAGLFKVRYYNLFNGVAAVHNRDKGMMGDNGERVAKYKAELKERLFKALRFPVRFIPNWIDAVGAGVFIATHSRQPPRLQGEAEGA